MGALAIALPVVVCLGEPENAFRERMAELHPNRLAADAAPVAADETVVDASWRIVCETDDDVVRHAAADLADYFEKSMGLGIGDWGSGIGGLGIALSWRLIRRWRSFSRRSR